MRRRRSRRDYSAIASRRLASTVAPFRVSPIRPSLWDGRFFSFEPVRSARLKSGLVATARLGDLRVRRWTRAGKIWSPFLDRQTKSRLVFDQAKSVNVCVRRQKRKEVLHALGRVGRGGTSRKVRYRRGPESSISCRS